MNNRIKGPDLNKTPATPQIRVLAVGLGSADKNRLGEIFADAAWPCLSQAQWVLETSGETISDALAAVRARDAAIVLCERDLGKDSWRDLYSEVARLPQPPCFIVTSRMADEYLWAEVLNLGAYDVLAAPFDSTEVGRVLHSAWIHKSDFPVRRARTATSAPVGVTWAAVV